MELRQCRYFISVAKLGSISQAALELHIAQPALTRQMQKLEEDLRVTLFNRTGRGVQLTDAGSQFLVDAEILINNVTVIKERAVRASRGECGNISLALPVIQNAAPPITIKEKMLLAYPTEWKWPDNKEPRYLRELQNLDFNLTRDQQLSCFDPIANRDHQRASTIREYRRNWRTSRVRLK